MNIRLTATLLIVLLAAAPSLSQTPLGTAFTYQGRLVNGGSPANGAHDLRFSLYDAASGGNLIDGPICLDDVSVTDGLFTASVDFGPSNVNFAGDARWLAIEVRADTTPGNCASGSYTSLTPRQALTPTPFALGLRLPFTATAGNAISGLLNLTSTNGPAITGTGGPGSGSNAGVSGLTPSTGGIGVFGRATSPTGTNYGGWFQTLSSGGYGVRGDATAASGTTYGVYGTAASPTGYGVYGESGGNSGSGVYGNASAGSGTTYGVQGQSASTYGTGVYGLATATSSQNYGGYFQSDSTLGTGVYGYASADTGPTFGVYGLCGSPTGTGVYGSASVFSGINFGVYGETDSTSGRGVFGVATASSGTNYAVRGLNSNPAGYAVYAAGDLGCSGNKAFVIDHPLDPENKYLKHYCCEGPEPINTYRGTVVTDGHGEAWVALPDYFAEINKTPSYQLTVVDESDGDTFVQAKVAREIRDNQFKIRTSAPHVKVCWEVNAVRNDRWVQAHGAPVEVEKQDLERGKYQHPELYGQPPELGMDFDAGHAHPSPTAPPEAR